MFICRVLFYFLRSIKVIFWQWYHLHYCLTNNVLFADKKYVRFNGHSIISINSTSNVKVGRAFIVNSGPEYGIGATMSKISVGPGATLKIGDFVGISSTSLLVRDSLTIGNHVNVGGGNLYK